MSAPILTSTSLLTCSFGAAPSPLNVLPQNRVDAVELPAATIMDNKPMVNVMPFGLCQSPANPEVISLTAAALGVFTPAPCVPVIPAPWTPGVANVTIADLPAVDANCKLICAWGGIIAVQTPAQMTVSVP